MGLLRSPGHCKGGAGGLDVAFVGGGGASGMVFVGVGVALCISWLRWRTEAVVFVGAGVGCGHLGVE